MKKDKRLYLMTSVLFSLLTLGYIVIIVVDFYYGYTPGYLILLHILTTVAFLAAAIVNLKRYRK